MVKGPAEEGLKEAKRRHRASGNSQRRNEVIMLPQGIADAEASRDEVEAWQQGSVSCHRCEKRKYTEIGSHEGTQYQQWQLGQMQLRSAGQIGA